MAGSFFLFSHRLIPRWPLMSCLGFLLCLFAACVGNADVDSRQPPESTLFYGKSFSVYMLSRGKGVPQEARTSFDQVYQELVTLKQQGKLSFLKQEVIGLEGERRICAEFADGETARQLFVKIKKIAMVTDLFDIVIESCAK